MDFGLSYDQLAPVAGPIRAGVISYDGRDPNHRVMLRDALPRFLGRVAAVHGATFPIKNIDNIVRIADDKQIKVDFFLVALEVGGPVMLAGLATGAPTFGVEWGKDNKPYFSLIEHGEDLSVDKDIIKKFRELTVSSEHPKGIGAGTWFVREQIRRSVNRPYWAFAGRDNEHYLENAAIVGLMDNFGRVGATERDSAILQLDRLTDNMKGRWGVNNIVTEGLPVDPLGLRLCPNNFVTRWSSEDGEQQLAVIYLNLPPTTDEEGSVWTKIKSNGNPPKGEMLKEVLASLLRKGAEVIADPDCLWGVPADKRNDVHKTFGGPVPVMHLHTVKEKQIVDALLDMGAIHRKYGKANMVSGAMNLNAISNPEAVLGQSLPEATFVTGVNLEPAANDPDFSFKESKPRKDASRPSAYLQPRRAMSIAA